MKNPDLYAEPMTEKHMDEIREFAAKNESMEDLLRRLVTTVEKGDANPAERVNMVKEIRAIVDGAKILFGNKC